MKNLAIFASGSGSNAEEIIKYFKTSDKGQVRLICSNKAGAYVLQRADNHKIPSLAFNKAAFENGNNILEALQNHAIDYIILAGFLWKIPAYLIDNYQDKIINIHPALLPQYGGKGMYGMHVHQAVVKNNETETGITIHYVNEHYDEGAIIFQAKCEVLANDTAEDVAKKIHELEMEYFPKVVDELLK